MIGKPSAKSYIFYRSAPDSGILVSLFVAPTPLVIYFCSVEMNKFVLECDCRKSGYIYHHPGLP